MRRGKLTLKCLVLKQSSKNAVYLGEYVDIEIYDKVAKKTLKDGTGPSMFGFSQKMVGEALHGREKTRTTISRRASLRSLRKRRWA
jgi:hypothetical protein